MTLVRDASERDPCTRATRLAAGRRRQGRRLVGAHRGTGARRLDRDVRHPADRRRRIRALGTRRDPGRSRDAAVPSLGDAGGARDAARVRAGRRRCRGERPRLPCDGRARLPGPVDRARPRTAGDHRRHVVRGHRRLGGLRTALCVDARARAGRRRWRSGPEPDGDDVARIDAVRDRGGRRGRPRRRLPRGHVVLRADRPRRGDRAARAGARRRRGRARQAGGLREAPRRGLRGLPDGRPARVLRGRVRPPPRPRADARVVHEHPAPLQPARTTGRRSGRSTSSSRRSGSSSRCRSCRSSSSS